MMPQHDEVLDYFAWFSQGYDSIDEDPFWQLSDHLLWHLMERWLPGPGQVLFDAGGGTGTWSLRIVRATGCRAIVYDVSPHMLDLARKRIAAAQMGDRIEVVEGDLAEISLPAASVDCIVSLYDPLCYLDRPASALTEFARILKPGSPVLAVVDTWYHGLAVMAQRGDVEEYLSLARHGRARWDARQPRVRFFQFGELLDAFRASGLRPCHVFGFPVTLYPGREASMLLADAQAREEVWRIEERLCREECLAARGCHILVVGKKDEGRGE